MIALAHQKAKGFPASLRPRALRNCCYRAMFCDALEGLTTEEAMLDRSKTTADC
jgi:hypothetical protein